MRTKRILISGGILAAIAVVALYAAIAYLPGNANAATPAKETASPSLPADTAIQPWNDGGSSPVVAPEPNGSCSNCTSDQECLTLQCGGGCDPIKCVARGLGHICMCE